MKKIVLFFVCILGLTFFVFKAYHMLSNTDDQYENVQYENLKYNFINEAVQKFANHWLKEEIEKSPDRNIVISPVSLYLAFAMLAQGTDTQAYDELSEILGSKELLLWEFNHSLRKSSALYSKYAKIANSIWGDTFKNSFKKEVKQNLDAEVKKLPSTTQPINDWVREKTEGQIQNILAERPLRKEEFILVNSIFFEASWKDPFKKENTTKRDFYTPSGIVSVDMMQKTEHMPYYEDDIMQAIILFYKGGQDYSNSYYNIYKGDYMTIYLPKKGITWNDFVSHLSKNKLNFNFRSNQEVTLGLPRFESDYTVDNLIDTLKRWNITGIFNKGHLEKMSKNSFITGIIHKAKIKVDEEGTVASATTVLQYLGVSEPISVWVDHPFVFKINDGLFIGTIVNPKR